MVLSEAIITSLRYRQRPMTAQQIAYFLCLNNMIRTEKGLQEIISRVEEEVYNNPGQFTITDELISISAWCEAEQRVVQHVYRKALEAVRLFQETSQDADQCNNMVLALLLYKRLSDISRSQQLGAPIVPAQWKFNKIITGTTLDELPVRVYDVMDYIERTDDRLANTFLYGKEELSSINDAKLQTKLLAIMRLLAELQLDEEHVPTPLFQAVFSRLFWNNIKYTSREIGAAV